MNKIKSLKCKELGQENPAVPKHICEFFFGPLEAVYDYEWIMKEISREKIASRAPTLWRYWEYLPVETQDVITLHEGYTPLWKSRNLGKILGLNNLYIKNDAVNPTFSFKDRDHPVFKRKCRVNNLYIKNDAVNPTFSFKDRVVSVALTRSRELGFDVVACASTGNLAGAVAAYGAVGRFKTFVFIPADLEMGKVVGAGVYDPIIVG